MRHPVLQITKLILQISRLKTIEYDHDHQHPEGIFEPQYIWVWIETGMTMYGQCWSFSIGLLKLHTKIKCEITKYSL